LSQIPADEAREDQVLVVGADPATNESLLSVLRGAGLRAATADGSTEALIARLQGSRAAVIVDNLTLDGKGTELASRLKKLVPDTVVLALTSLDSLDHEVETASDLDGVLVKPLLPQALIQSTRQALAIRDLVEENRRLAAGAVGVAGREEQTSQIKAPNRVEFVTRLERVLASDPDSGQPIAVVVVELGTSPSGPGVLAGVEVQKALDTALVQLATTRRKSDLVGKIAANRVAIGCSDVDSADDCNRFVKVVLAQVERPVVVNSNEHWFKPVAGASLTDEVASTADASGLLEQAEVALAWARDEGKPWRIFDKAMKDSVSTRLEIKTSIEEALDNGDLYVAYEPVLDLQTSNLEGVAARLLWRRPDQTQVLTSEFLSNELGAVPAAQLATWMVDRALGDLASWLEAQWLSEGFQLDMRVSARDVADAQLADTIEELLDRYQVPGNMLNIDLPSTAAHQAVTGDSALTRLSQIGVRFNLDDIGSGDACLGCLRDLPISMLKLDPSLIESLDRPDDARATALTRALTTMGHELNIEVVGKGVKTQGQRSALLAMGCDFAQGSTLGRPGPHEQPWEPDN
jgi:EAL domain-containing protein (putative c-di-GMP-specific phosphodiesterase class I)/CheY-like chemotaxis protein